MQIGKATSLTQKGLMVICCETQIASGPINLRQYASHPVAQEANLKSTEHPVCFSSALQVENSRRDISIFGGSTWSLPVMSNNCCGPDNNPVVELLVCYSKIAFADR